MATAQMTIIITATGDTQAEANQKIKQGAIDMSKQCASLLPISAFTTDPPDLTEIDSWTNSKLNAAVTNLLRQYAVESARTWRVKEAEKTYVVPQQTAADFADAADPVV